MTREAEKALRRAIWEKRLESIRLAKESKRLRGQVDQLVKLLPAKGAAALVVLCLLAQPAAADVCDSWRSAMRYTFIASGETRQAMREARTCYRERDVVVEPDETTRLERLIKRQDRDKRGRHRDR